MPERPTSPEAQYLAEQAVELHNEAQRLRREYLEATHATQDALLAAWREGASPTDLADMLGIGRVRVYQLMDKAEEREAKGK